MIALPALKALSISPKLIGGALLLAVAASTGWVARGKLAAAQVARVQAAAAEQQAKAEKRAREAIEAARAREQQIIDRTQEIVHETRDVLATMARDAAAADAAAGGLRDAAARIAARCNTRHAPAAPAGGSPAASLPSSMHDGERLLRVLAELDGAAGAYADAADRSRAAGLACERIYEQVRAGAR